MIASMHLSSHQLFFFLSISNVSDPVLDTGGTAFSKMDKHY